jgi:hypothetical protein
MAAVTKMMARFDAYYESKPVLTMMITNSVSPAINHHPPTHCRI